MHKESLLFKLHRVPVYTELARKIGYVGFPARELYDHLKSIAEKHGCKEVSLALQELVTFERWRVMLNLKARAECWQLLGPPPELWDKFYRHPDGTPMERPKGREKPPEFTYEPDQQMQGLAMFSPTQLSIRLRTLLAKKKMDGKTRFLAERVQVEIQALEAEMLRRGMDPSVEGKEYPEEKPKPEKKLGKPRKKKV